MTKVGPSSSMNTLSTFLHNLPNDLDRIVLNPVGNTDATFTGSGILSAVSDHLHSLNLKQLLDVDQWLRTYRSSLSEHLRSEMSQTSQTSKSPQSWKSGNKTKNNK